MKRCLISIFSILLLFVSADGKTTFDDETIKYVISYKWGLIHKDAGEATLNLKKNGQNYDIVLTAKTKPWADKIYQVRDTLKASVRVSDFKPLSYTKSTHEKGKYKRDEIVYSHNGSQTTGKAKRYRYDKGKETVTTTLLSASGPVFDMLTVFYYLRTLDYANLSSSKVYTATVFSGKMKETIKIKCLGKEKIKLKNKTEREAYHIQFNFTKDGGKKSSDNMDTWISTDSSHIPLYLTAKLPFGEIRAYLQ